MQRIDPDLVPLRMTAPDGAGDRLQPPNTAERLHPDCDQGQLGQWESPTPEEPSSIQSAAKNGKLPANGRSSHNGKAGDASDLDPPESSAASLVETSPETCFKQTADPSNPSNPSASEPRIEEQEPAGDESQDLEAPQSERGFLQ
ncbi:MAG: hypothetical protein SNJ81_17750, partial [Cyanobacteriota bacterium]